MIKLINYLHEVLERYFVTNSSKTGRFAWRQIYGYDLLPERSESIPFKKFKYDRVTSWRSECHFDKFAVVNSHNEYIWAKEDLSYRSSRRASHRPLYEET